MCRCDLHAWGLRASRLAAALQTRGQEAARRPGICPRPPGCRFDPRRDASLQPFSRSATVLAQERYSAVVMQSCGCQRPETILVIRVVRRFRWPFSAAPRCRAPYRSARWWRLRRSAADHLIQKLCNAHQDFMQYARTSRYHVIVSRKYCRRYENAARAVHLGR